MRRILRAKQPITINVGSRLEILHGNLWVTWPYSADILLRPGMSLVAVKGTVAEALSEKAEVEILSAGSKLPSETIAHGKLLICP